LYTHSRSHWPSTSAFCHSAEVGRTALSTEQFRSSALFCGGPVDLEFAARQSSWPRTESRYFQTSAEDIHFCEILMTKCIKRIRDLFEYALCKFTLYLLYLPVSNRYSSYVFSGGVHSCRVCGFSLRRHDRLLVNSSFSVDCALNLANVYETANDWLF